MKLVLTLMFFLATLPCMAQIESNPMLARLYAEDLQDRSVPPRDIDWTVVSPRDAARRTLVLHMLRAGEVRSAADYHAAAMIFQHGETPEHIELAHSLANIGCTLDPTDRSLKWLAAATWDRYLMRRGKAQWYGTQYVMNPDNKRFELYQVDATAINDQDRAAQNVPSLAEARAKEAELNP